MGSGTFTSTSYKSYSTSLGRDYDDDSGRVSGQSFEARKIDEDLDPRKFQIRECCNSEEHPNTIPVILALDVTGSMGPACAETAAALGVIITNLYEKFKDIEFCVMGIGDLAYDDAPIQMSQFESDIRIAESLDKIYMEMGGGGNRFESYTAAWYMGLNRTKLDCWEQGRKGIIITMGDEPLNPYLPYRKLNSFVNSSEKKDVETKELYELVSKKFYIYHISVNDDKTCYRNYERECNETWKKLLKENYYVSTINRLAETIENCIEISYSPDNIVIESVNENGEISW